ncbi:hypothetical protein RN001_008441 [Aquatica leii]|uniref:Uncharacterized protein n=1 Tax=Aquatica leii TaxID=1421715 RepID=A0AAN7Q554_9COLE|nr:hypothetical protein RN001_008441 [Aquatica leii]
MDKYQHLATLLLRCLTQELDNYRIITNKEDNNFYLISESKTGTHIIELSNNLLTNEDVSTGKFYVSSCLDNIKKLNVSGKTDYFLCINGPVVENDFVTKFPEKFILKCLYKVNYADDASINIYISEASNIDLEVELNAFCKLHGIEFIDQRLVLEDFCLYLQTNEYLTKDGVTGTLLYLFLRRYKLDLDFLGGVCQYNDIWGDITNDKSVTVVDFTCVDFLSRHTMGAVVRRAKSKCDLGNLYRNLWLSNEVSLLLRVDNSEDFTNVFNILLCFSLGVRVTVLSDCLTLPTNNLQCFVTGNDLNEDRFNLSNVDINVQNRFNVKLGEILSESTIKSLKCSDLIRIIDRQVDCLCSVPEYYVQRRFFNVTLSLSVFDDVDEFFVVRNKAGTGNMVLLNLINKGLSNVSVINDGDGDFNPPCTVPTHFVNFYGENWVEWKDSIGEVTSLRSYVSVSNYVTCELSNLLQEQRKTIVVSANVGMGKSMFLNALSLSLPKDCWVETIDLCKHQQTEDFSKNDFVFQYYGARKLVHVLIDGFDQAFYNNPQSALQSLKYFENLGFKLWVVVRPDNVEVVEKQLKTISVRLAPFTAQNQRDFLYNYFRHTYADDNVEEFVEELWKIVQKFFSDFTQTPLDLQILADVFVHDYKKFTMTGIIDFENQFRVVDALDSFLKARFDLLCKKYDVITNEFIERFPLLALTAKFDETDLVNLRINDTMNQLRSSLILPILSMEEIIESDASPRFKHDIFNEYLAAKWICENVSYKDELVKDTVNVLLNRRNSQLPRFAGVFTMFDYILLKDCSLLMTLVNKKVYQVQMQSGTTSFSERDKGGRTIAHIAALYGIPHPAITHNASIEINDAMVNIIALSDEKLIVAEDTLLGYTSLDYALLTSSLAVANAIWKKVPNLLVNVTLNLPDLETYFEYCIKVDSYKYLYRNLLKHVLTRFLLQNKITENSDVDSLLQQLNFDETIRDNITEYIKTLDCCLMRHLLETLQLKLSNSRTYSDLNLACAFGTVENIMDLVVGGAQINKLQLYTPLHCATIHKRVDLVDLLLSLGATIDAKDTTGNTPLHLACQVYCNIPMIEKLLQHGASMTATNANGDTPLHCALKSDLPNIARLFLPRKRNELLVSLHNGNYRQNVDLDAQNNEGDTPLLLAIKHKHTGLIYELLASYVDVNIINKAGNSCLHYAAENQNCAVLTELIYNYICLNGLNADGETPLLVALKSGKMNLAKTLIERGADVDASDKDFMSCLHYAVAFGKRQIIVDLLDRGANINKKTANGVTPLMQALLNENSSTAHLLIHRGADVNLTDATNSTALHYAARYNLHHVIKLSISLGAEKDPFNTDAETPLITAFKYSHSTAVKTLIDEGADVTVKDKSGFTCLHLAASASSPELVEKLLAKNVDINIQNSEGNTPLLVALDNQSKFVAQLLLNKGADVNVKNINGYSAMHYASKYGLEEFLSQLIKRGMDVNEKTRTGETALILHVANNSRRDTVKLLIDNGADLSVVDSATGNSCLHYLVKEIEDEIISDVVAKGANINVQNNNGDTPLHFAIKYGYPCTLQLLLALGADANIGDYANGSTPLHWAVAMRKTNSVQLLLENGADANKENNEGETPIARARRLGFNNIVQTMTVQDDNYQKYKMLWNAVKKGEIFTVTKLLTEDVEIDKKNDEGQTLLMLALDNGHLGVAKYLIARGASIHLTNNRGFSSLHYAASAGDLTIVRHHLDNGVDINITNINGDTPFITALYAQTIHVVQFLLERQASIELSPVTNPKQTCLHHAIEAGSDSIVLQILDRGFYLEKLSSRGLTGLMKALHYRNTHIASLLIERGADVNARDESRATGLHLAATEGLYDMLQLLLDKGVNINVCDSTSDTPLMNAIACDKDIIAMLLLSRGAEVHVKNTWGCYPLHNAVVSGMDKVIPLILDLGFDIDTETDNGETALYVALVNRKIDTARLLMNRGARIDIVNSTTNTTCLHLAAEAGFEELVREALKVEHFSITDKNTYNFTPLSLAVQYENVNIAKLLFENVITLEHFDEDYDYLHLAAEFGDVNIMTALLDKGLNINDDNKDGETPLMVALRLERWGIVDLVLSRGADVTIKETQCGLSCLYYFALNGDDQKILHTIEKGVDVNEQQFNGSTALMEAVKNKNLSTVKLLLAHGADSNITNNNGYNSLHYAASTTDQILLAIIDTIEDINQRTIENETALLLALQSSQYDLALILLEHGACDLDCGNGNSCLHYSAENDATEIFTWVANKFGNIDAVNEDGNTPLMLALKSNNNMIVEALLERGANTGIVNKDGCSCIHYSLRDTSTLSLFINADNINQKNKSGLAPIMIALNDHYNECVTMLLEHGADPFVEDNDGNTCLHLAATYEEVDLFKTFLEKGIDVNKLNKNGDNSLQVAIEHGKMKIAKIILDMGGDPNTVTQTGKTCLLKAIELDDKELTDYLIKCKVDINIQSNSDQTPLSVALENGLTAVSKLLIQMGADVNIQRGGTYLHLAAEYGVNVVDELLDAGLDINRKDEHGETPLTVALKSNQVEILTVLLERGADPNARNNEGYSCLHHAAGEHESSIVSLFLTKGVSMNDRTSRGNTPLLYALHRDKLDNAKLLIAHGAPFDVSNYKGDSCLYYAAKAGFDDLVAELIEKGVYVDKLNNYGGTPFLAALIHSRLSTAKLLLEKGADVNARVDGNTAWFDSVVSMHDVEILDMMIKKGVDVNYGVNTKYTVLLLALKKGNKEMADLLITKGANVHLVDVSSGDSCLHHAAKNGFADIVTYLLDEGLDINRLNNLKVTPLKLAFLSGSVDTVNVLLSRGALMPAEHLNYSYLHYAAEVGDDNIVLELINQGFDVNSINENGDTPVFVALMNEHLSTAELLLQHDSDIFLKNAKGHNLLHYATLANASDIKDALLEKGLVDDD